MSDTQSKFVSGKLDACYKAVIVDEELDGHMFALAGALTPEQAASLMDHLNKRFEFKVCIQSNRVFTDLAEIKSISDNGTQVVLRLNDGEDENKYSYFKRITLEEENLSYLSSCLEFYDKLNEFDPFWYVYKRDPEYFDDLLTKEVRLKLVSSLKNGKLIEQAMVYHKWLKENHDDELHHYVREWIIHTINQLNKIDASTNKKDTLENNALERKDALERKKLTDREVFDALFDKDENAFDSYIPDDVLTNINRETEDSTETDEDWTIAKKRAIYLWLKLNNRDALHTECVLYGRFSES